MGEKLYGDSDSIIRKGARQRKGRSENQRWISWIGVACPWSMLPRSKMLLPGMPLMLCLAKSMIWQKLYSEGVDLSCGPP